MVANNVLSSGQIAADLKLRDQTLVQAQTQVDQMAATLASSLSDITTAGHRRDRSARRASTVNTSNVLPGNTINLTYTDTATNTQHQISIVNVDRSDRAAAAERRQSESAAGRRQFLARHGLGRVAAQHRARRLGLQFSNLRLDAAIC